MFSQFSKIHETWYSVQRRDWDIFYHRSSLAILWCNSETVHDTLWNTVDYFTCTVIPTPCRDNPGFHPIHWLAVLDIVELPHQHNHCGKTEARESNMCTLYDVHFIVLLTAISLRRDTRLKVNSRFWYRNNPDWNFFPIRQGLIQHLPEKSDLISTLSNHESSQTMPVAPNHLAIYLMSGCCSKQLTEYRFDACLKSS